MSKCTLLERLHSCCREEKLRTRRSFRDSLASNSRGLIYRPSMVNSPCCPNRTSRSKLTMPTQIIGEISTPPIGWIILRVGDRKGSVGMRITLKGNRCNSTWGYQVRTMRKMNSRVMKAKMMPMLQLARVRKSIIVKLCN